VDTNSDLWRRITEARHYIRQGHITAAAVDALCQRIAKKRGEQAAEQLRQDMREQYSKRGEWEWDMTKSAL
jgi:hypothetical protein